MPYLVLKSSTSAANYSLGQSQVLWSDLDFLPLHTGEGLQTNHYSIFAAHTSVAIGGAHNFDWHGYAFGNTGPGDPVAEEYEVEADAYNCNRTEATPDDWYHAEAEDFFAAGGCQSISTPGQPIMDPRVYFLRAVQHRLNVVIRSHKYLVRKLEEAFHIWVSYCKALYDVAN